MLVMKKNYSAIKKLFFLLRTIFIYLLVLQYTWSSNALMIVYHAIPSGPQNNRLLPFSAPHL